MSAKQDIGLDGKMIYSSMENSVPKTTPETGKLLISLCQNILSVESSPSMSLKSLQSEVSQAVLSPGMFSLLLLGGRGLFVIGRDGGIFGKFVLLWIGLVFQKGKKKTCFIEVVVKLKIGACRRSKIISLMV